MDFFFFSTVEKNVQFGLSAVAVVTVLFFIYVFMRSALRSQKEKADAIKS